MRKQATAKSFCVACGSRNVVHHASKLAAAPAGGPLVQCRSCGVVSPDFNQRRPREGVRPGSEPLDKAAALVMADQVLDALAQPAVRTRLLDALDTAQGDVALICHMYLPTAIDAFARAIAPFGFAAGLEGVAASVEALQTLARDDAELVRHLVALRQALTPTGEWIRQDREAEQLDQRRLDQQRAEQERREQDERLAAEAAARNAALARLRARKLSLGLDPSMARLPVLERVPAPLVAAREGDRVRLRVDVRFSRRRQWFFNGKPLEDDAQDPAPLRRGARGCTLTLPRVSKRVAGDYHCVCENDEGRAVTPVTRVEVLGRLRAERLAERKLPLAQQHARPLMLTVDGDDGRQAVVLCAPSESVPGGGGVALLSAESLAPMKLVLPLQTAAARPVVAWSGRTQTLAVVTDAAPSVARGRPKRKGVAPSGAVQVAVFAVGRPATAAGHPQPAPDARAPPLRGAQPPSRPKASASNSSSASGSSVIAAQPVATQAVAPAGAFEGEVRAAAFADSGRLLMLTDLDRGVAVYSFDRSQPQPVQLLHTVRSADGARIRSTAAAADAPVLALTFRNAPYVDIVRLRSANEDKTGAVRNEQPVSIASTRRHQLALAVHLAAVDRAGLFAAVAESAGCLKAWVSIINLNTRDRSAAESESPLRSKRRFGAHVGAVTALQWTDASSLLLSSGIDGFVKIWDVACPAAAAPGSDCVALLAQFHVGESVIYMALTHETSTLVTVVRTRREAQSATIQTRALLPLKELEAFRRDQQLGAAAAQIQRVWNGHRTRELLAELLGERHRRRRSPVGEPSQ